MRLRVAVAQAHELAVVDGHDPIAACSAISQRVAADRSCQAVESGRGEQCISERLASNVHRSSAVDDPHTLDAIQDEIRDVEHRRAVQR